MMESSHMKLAKDKSVLSARRDNMSMLLPSHERAVALQKKNIGDPQKITMLATNVKRYNEEKTKLRSEKYLVTLFLFKTMGSILTYFIHTKILSAQSFASSSCETARLAIVFFSERFFSVAQI